MATRLATQARDSPEPTRTNRYGAASLQREWEREPEHEPAVAGPVLRPAAPQPACGRDDGLPPR